MFEKTQSTPLKGRGSEGYTMGAKPPSSRSTTMGIICSPCLRAYHARMEKMLKKFLLRDWEEELIPSISQGWELPRLNVSFPSYFN